MRNFRHCFKQTLSGVYSAIGSFMAFISSVYVVFAAAPAFAEEVVQEPAFGEQKWKLFDVSFNTPMNTISGLTEWSRDINHVYLITTVVSIFVFFAVSIPLIYTLYKFRERPGDQRIPKQFHGNATLEVLWTVIPVILLLFIAIPTWRVLFKHAHVPENALNIEVIGHQWWWEFRYPDNGNIITASELVVPENTPIKFTMWSEDVIHSFWIPKWGGKKDVLPGHKNILTMSSPALKEPSKKGGDLYQGQCVELCGASHALMRFNARVVSQAEFESWTKTTYTPPRVETASQRAGEEVFVRCAACHVIAGTPSEQIPGNKIGPNLTNFGSRTTIAGGTRPNTAEHFAAWVRNPAAIKPGSLMPNLGLTEQEIADVSAYLRQSTNKQF